MAHNRAKIVILNPSYFAFLSGISVSIATKLLLGLALEDYKNRFNSFIIVSNLLFFLAGLFLIFFSWKLEEPHRKWKTTSREIGWNEDEIRLAALGNHIRVLWFLLIGGVSLFVMGIACLFLTS